MHPTQGAMTALIADRVLLGRTSTAERVAGILRDRISTGYFSPGARLIEEEITEVLGVSRNTLREAFRLLTHERLLVHQLNRGVFVRILDVQDVTDLFRVRKFVECAVVRAVVTPTDVSRLAAAIMEGERAVEDQDWRALGTANIRFHEALAALAGSDRINEFMCGVLAELRLVFHAMDNPRQFHEPYLARNREILGILADGNGEHAEEVLRKYLDDSENQVVPAYARRHAEGNFDA